MNFNNNKPFRNFWNNRRTLFKIILVVVLVIIVFFISSIYLVFFSSSSFSSSPNSKNRNTLHNSDNNEGAATPSFNEKKSDHSQKDTIDTVPPLSVPNNKNKNNENNQNQQQQPAGEQFEPEPPKQPSRKICALFLDTRNLMAKNYKKKNQQETKDDNDDDDDEAKNYLPENQAIVETVKTIVQALNVNYKKKNGANNVDDQNAPDLLLFSPFVDQPSSFPPSIFNSIQSQPTKIKTLKLSQEQLGKLLVFDHFQRSNGGNNHRRRHKNQNNGSSAFFDADDQQQQQQQQQQQRGVMSESLAEEKKEKEDEQKQSTFIEAVERILLAIDATKSDPAHNCQSLVVVNSVFSAFDDTQRRLEKAILALLAHPASSDSRRQIENNPLSYILSPLIISGNSQTRSSNIFSFGNDVVELFEGLAWAVPRYYGYPIHYAPANEEATYASAPSGVLAYFTPASFRFVDKIINDQLTSHRYRIGREWIEKARGNYIVENSVLQEQRQMDGRRHNTNDFVASVEDGYKRRNPNGIPDVDIDLASEHHQHQHHQNQHHPSENEQKPAKKKKSRKMFETHFLACDAALAELSATAYQKYNVLPLVVRSSVPPLVFQEEGGHDSLSSRYMLAVAHAASGLSGVHRGPLESLNSNNNNNNNQQQLLLLPQKLPALPVANVIKALPFVTSIAGDLWFRFIGRQYLPNLTLFWDPYCGCTGINVEAVNFLVPLERYVRTRAVAAKDCFCPGFPLADQFALHRMQNAKLLSRGSTSKFHVWVSHKPVDAFPSFPYDGSIKYSAAEFGASPLPRPSDDRPDLVIGRTMTESDRIPADWVARLNDRASPSRVDELWVPSQYQHDAFRRSGVRADLPIVVIPEAIDTNFYDPQFVTVLDSMDKASLGCPLDPGSCFVFLSNFKWEHRKGWDLLLRAYFTAFTLSDNVVLVLKTYLYGAAAEGLTGNDARNPEKIRNRIFTWVRGAMRGVNMKRLPKIWIVADELPAYLMPRLYRGADCFVLPTRGEGWGLPLQEAMAMGLVTIGPNFGGNLDFMPRHNHGKTHFLLNISGYEVIDPATGSYLRDATPEEVKSDEGRAPRTQPGLFGRPDVNELTELMRHVYSGMSREERIKMGKAARASIAQKFGRPAVAEIVLKRLMHLYQARHNGTNTNSKI